MLEIKGKLTQQNSNRGLDILFYQNGLFKLVVCRMQWSFSEKQCTKCFEPSDVTTASVKVNGQINLIKNIKKRSNCLQKRNCHYKDVPFFLSFFGFVSRTDNCISPTSSLVLIAIVFQLR